MSNPNVQNLLHAFGDSFAHVKADGTHYPVESGHFVDSIQGMLLGSSNPDDPQTHPDAYKNYVNTLFAVASEVTVIPRVSKDTVVNLENNVISTSEKYQVTVLNNAIGTVSPKTSLGLVNSPVQDCGELNSCSNKAIGSQVNPQINKVLGVKK